MTLEVYSIAVRDGKEEVQGQISGYFGIHKDENIEMHVVSHLATGHRIANLYTPDIAEKMMADLNLLSTQIDFTLTDANYYRKLPQEKTNLIKNVVSKWQTEDDKNVFKEDEVEETLDMAKRLYKL